MRYPITSKRFFRWRRSLAISLMSVFLCVGLATSAQGMCGIFVARTVAHLTNIHSRVIIAHQGNRSVFTMENDVQGDVKEFARIVPMPVLPTRKQVRIGDPKVIEQIDHFTTPRLASYDYNFDRLWWDEFYGSVHVFLGVVIVGWMVSRVWRRVTWQRLLVEFLMLGLLAGTLLGAHDSHMAKKGTSSSYGSTVQVADQFAVGEYDVTLLSATESNALTQWLKQNGYQIPDGAEPMFQSYIQAGMKFFIVKINLDQAQKIAPGFLRPIVVEYDSPELMLPIRLSTLNAKGDQDLIVYILAPEQVAEVANYPTQTVPTDAISTRHDVSGKELPVWIQDHFEDFYRAVFQKAYAQSDQSIAFLEYAGKVAPGACNPCTMRDTEDLQKNLLQAGVAWTRDKTYVTRLHVRYNATTFPKDLEFRMVSPETLRSRLQAEGKLMGRPPDSLFQARYVVRPTSGFPMGLSGLKYWWNDRKTTDNLAQLTGWSPAEIEQKEKISQRIQPLP
jgi:hypothetical protein